VFAVLVLTVLSPSLTSTLITIAAVNWVGSARVVRAETLKLRDGAFVKAAQARGVPPAQVLFYEILPNLRGLLALLLGFAGAEALALEGGLAYLGIAPPPPAATWGAMLTAGLPYVATAWWIALVPSMAIVCAVAAARIASQRLEDSMFR
jgi:peptide/nickel transport system permease protein